MNRLTDDLFNAIMTGRPDPTDEEPDYEAELEMRHDPEAALDRAEDMYEAWLDANATQ